MVLPARFRSYVPGHAPYVFQAHTPPLSREPCCMAYPSFGAGSDHYGWSRQGAGRVDSGGSPRRCGLVFSVGQTLVRNRAQRRYAPYFRGWRRRRKQRRVAGKVAEGQYMGNPLPQKAGDVALPDMPCAGNIFLRTCGDIFSVFEYGMPRSCFERRMNKKVTTTIV